MPSERWNKKKAQNMTQFGRDHKCVKCGKGGFPHEAAVREHERTDAHCLTVQQQALGRTQRVKQYGTPISFTGLAKMWDDMAFEPKTKKLEAKEYTPQQIMDLTMAEVRSATASMYDEIRRLEKHYNAKIQGLERALQSLTTKYDLDAKIAARVTREPLDYTKMHSEEEDGLEEGYRGWPKLSEKKVF